MAIDYDKRECEKFLKKLQHWENPTWGFYVYGNYARLLDGNDDETKPQAQEAADARFQALLSKVHAHAVDVLRYRWPMPYNQQLIDVFRLQPAAYLPGASLAEVCEHFRENFAVIDYDHPLNEDKNGHKYEWCLVIDDEALQSIESVPDPIGPTPPEGADPRQLSWQASDAFVILLDKDHTLMEKPEVLAVSSRSGKGPRIEWNGWLKFSLIDFKRVYEELYHADDIKNWIKDENKIIRFIKGALTTFI